ncbi:MAG: hypothetical protein EOO71_07755 [Myxococcaceae bacterium]|nr:MAG: hypothetical protein EOO71_07755 [Myxococcaceae bacterium]
MTPSDAVASPAWGLSNLSLPFRFLTNPHLPSATKRVLELVPAGVLGERHEVEDFTALASRFYPDASEEGLVLGAMLVTWLFAVDDTYDRDATFAAEPVGVQQWMRTCQRLVEHEPLPTQATPMHRFSHLFGTWLAERTNPSWRWRFLLSLEAFFRGSLETVKQRGAKRVPDMEWYLSTRGPDSGSELCLLLHEPLGGFELTEDLLKDVELQRLRELCIRHLFIVNDMVSYELEVTQRDIPGNLLRLMMEAESLSFEDAVTHCIELANREALLFEALASKRCARAGEPMQGVEHYVRGMRALMRGNLDWALTAERYRTPMSPFPELRTPRVPPIAEGAA